MKAWSSLGLAVVCIGGVLLLASTGAESQNQRLASVVLQPTTPGTPQTGNTNVAGSSIAGQFLGGGGGLTNLNASNLAVGTVPESRLGSNVALLSVAQTFSAAKTFAVAPSFTAGTPFTVTSTGPVANLNADLLDGYHASAFARLDGNNAWTGANTFSNVGNSFSGNGGGLSHLNASNVSSGTLADERLSTNVDLLNGLQTFVAVKTFAATAKFANAAMPFTVTATALVTNLNADLLDGYHAASFARLDANNSWTGANTFSNASNSFAGNGAGLTGLNASNVSSGTLSDARVSSNVALLNLAQTFSAVKTFSASASFTNATVPFAVSSTAKVGNLNADLLDGFSTGNGSGQIPLSNGTSNTNLNADLHDGYHAGNGSGQVPISNGTVNTNLNADLHDGYHAGNSANQVPVSNGTVNTGLNADKTDGNHVASTSVFTASGIQYVVSTGYCKIYATGSSPHTLRIENPSGSGYWLRYYYSVNFGAPTFGNLAAGSTVDTSNLNDATIDIRIYSGGGFITYMGCDGGNGWLRGHVIYTN